jgi:hypothetical protein
MTNDQDDFDEDPQLRALLAQSDPARSLTPADPQGLARLLREVQEDTMNDAADSSGTTSGTTTPVGRRGRLSWLAGAAAVAVIAGGGFAVASSMGGDDPAGPQAADKPTPTQTPTSTADPVVVTLQAPTVDAKCAAPSPEILGQFDTVFSGTVTAVDGDVVTLRPDEVFAGDSADEIDIVGAGPDPRALGGQVTFEVGQTYYVSATGGQVSACGYSGATSDSDLEQLYDVAFR